MHGIVECRILYLEVWLSGLKRHPAKVLTGVIWSVGSNPTASAELYPSSHECLVT